MKYEEIKYGNAVKRLRREYEQAIKDVTIEKPLSYALYRVWEYYNSREKKRNVTLNEQEED